MDNNIDTFLQNDVGLKEAEALTAILDDLTLEDGLENIDPAILTSYIIEAGYAVNFYKSVKQVSAIRLVAKGIMQKRNYDYIGNKIYMLTHALLNYHRREIAKIMDVFNYGE